MLLRQSRRGPRSKTPARFPSVSTVPADDRSADRRAAEEHDGLQGQHPASHTRGRPDLDDGGRRRHEGDAATLARKPMGRRSTAPDVRPAHSIAAPNAAATPRGWPEISRRHAVARATDERARNSMHREQQGEGGARSSKVRVTSSGIDDREVEGEGADDAIITSGTHRSGFARRSEARLGSGPWPRWPADGRSSVSHHSQEPTRTAM